jgi:iturin family lipopeptide synthetase A
MNTYTINDSQLKQSETVLPTLRIIVAKLLKTDPEEVSADAPFLEMGADSIVLIDAIRQIENTFGIKISIRQLFEELTTLNALASYIEQNTTPQSPVIENIQQPEIASLIPTPTFFKPQGEVKNSTLMESIVRQQMQIMSQQLQLLQGLTPTTKLPALEHGHVKQASQNVVSVSATQTALKTPSSLPKKIDSEAQNKSSFSDCVSQPSLGNPLSTVSSPDSQSLMSFSLYYFGNYQSEFEQDKYNLLFKGAKFADEHGFTALWIPERHFHAFGGFSPNPSLIAAALAVVTQNIQLRAGSVVLPLHHPIRVAEEWSVVDNLSKGRVGISFASGWHPNDFVLAPQSFGKHREIMFQEIEIVKKLWRGESVQYRDGSGKDFDVKLFPMPMQSDVSVWVTIVNNPDTYVKAGEIGAGVLTNLMGQTVEELGKNIALYRESLAQHGHDPNGHVTVLLHTFVGEDVEVTRSQARQPFYNYLRTSVGLFKNLVKSQGLNVDIENLSEDDVNYIFSKAYERYIQTSALIGTPESCMPIIDNLIAIGVDEIACFVDFGIDGDTVLEGLHHLHQLKERYRLVTSAIAA